MGMAKVPPDIASELLYEVGWNARHRYVDVRQIQSGGAVRGALHTPLLPEPHTFLARAAAALYVSERSALGGSNEDLTESRIIVGCEGEEAEDARTAITMLQAAGYANSVLLEGGFERWRLEGYPCEAADGTDDEPPDSTF